MIYNINLIFVNDVTRTLCIDDAKDAMDAVRQGMAVLSSENIDMSTIIKCDAIPA